MNAFSRLLAYAGKNKDVLTNVGIGSAVNAVLGGLAEGPVGAVKYGLGDFLLSYPATLGARKLAGGAKLETLVDAAGKKTTRKVPTGIENAVNFGASLMGPTVIDVVSGGGQRPVVPTDMSSEQQIMQQLMQRQQLYGDEQLALMPGTMFQAQGLEGTLFRNLLSQMPSLEETAMKRRTSSIQPVDYMQYATELRRIA